MRKPMEIYDYKERRLISGEFRLIRELGTGAQLGYFRALSMLTNRPSSSCTLMVPISWSSD